MIFTPPITGGLHCGGPIVTEAEVAEELPPITGGLHCGIEPPIGANIQAVPSPPITGGLHCGWWFATVYRWPG